MKVNDVIINAEKDETVIRATHRAEDLVPAFLAVLSETDAYAKLKSEIPTEALEDEDHEWWESEDCSFFLNETLFDELNEYAPAGYYFGAHPGDGSDYGYWKWEEYSDIDAEDEAKIIEELVSEMTASAILAIPGVYEIIREELNNEVLAKWKEEQ